MASPSFSDVRRYAELLQRIAQDARDELLDVLEQVDPNDVEAVADGIRAAMLDILDRYGLAAAELGAEWYEYCRELAIGEGYTAIVGQASRFGMEGDFDAALSRLRDGKLTPEEFLARLGGIMVESIRQQARNSILENLADERDAALGRGDEDFARKCGYARVPVGETCAFCTILASQGFVYTSMKTALTTKSGDKYHKGCDCVAVPFSDASKISGYGKRLARFRDAYYEADAMRRSGNLPEELSDRIEDAKRRHMEDYRAGITRVRWDPTLNENTIIMRYLNPGMK